MKFVDDYEIYLLVVRVASTFLFLKKEKRKKI